MMATLTRVAIRVLDAIAGRRRWRNPEQQPKHLITGRRGEEAAYFHLRELGYTMVARNWRSRRRKGEIDLIGWDGGVLCFIEVKTRSTRAVKPAEAAVDQAKQSELKAMAREYLWRMDRNRKNIAVTATDAVGTSSHGASHRVCRFDIVSVYYAKDHDSATDITLFRNAFPMF